MPVQSKPGPSSASGKATGSTPTAAPKGDKNLEQTRADLGETVEALVAQADVPSRVEHSAAAKTAHLKESATDLKNATAERAAHLKDATAEKAAHLKDATAEKAAHLTDNTAEKTVNLRDTSTSTATDLKEKAKDAALLGHHEKATPEPHHTGHIAEATAQTSTRMACQAADAAERATAAISEARRRVTANPKPYALIGAALATAAAGVALIRRTR